MAYRRSTPLPADFYTRMDARFAAAIESAAAKARQVTFLHQRNEAKRLLARIDKGELRLDQWLSSYTFQHFDPRVAKIVARYFRRRDWVAQLVAEAA